MKRVLSGIQPTGIPHLGNYLGAMRRWVDYTEMAARGEAEVLFSIVDLHAITVDYEPRKMKDQVE